MSNVDPSDRTTDTPEVMVDYSVWPAGELGEWGKTRIINAAVDAARCSRKDECKLTGELFLREDRVDIGISGATFGCEYVDKDERPDVSCMSCIVKAASETVRLSAEVVTAIDAVFEPDSAETGE